jgi:mannosyltransferase
MPVDELLIGQRATEKSRVQGLGIRHRTLIEVCAVTALAGVLRFGTLGLQSYEFDEAWTLSVIHGSFTQMLHAVARSESTPPLYYMLAWIWTRIFGTGEVGLRSLSAVAGVATVPVVYAIGRTLASRRVGLVAAAIVATSPYLIFYSQEARAYALFALLSTVAMLCCVRAIKDPDPRRFWLWAAASFAAIATHYFALFPWLGQIVVLAVFGAPRRLLAWSSAAVGLASIPLLLLAKHQAGGGHVDWIGASSLLQRARVTIETFTLGATFKGTLPHSILAACGALAIVVAAGIVVAGFLLIRRAAVDERRAAAIAGLVGAIAVALPLLGVLVHKDYFLHKNLIPVVPLIAVVLAAGLGCRNGSRLGMGGAIALVFAGITLTVMSFTAPSMRRPDVRQISQRLGSPVQDRILIFVPRWQKVLEHYQGTLEDLPTHGRDVSEIDVFTTSSSLPEGTVPNRFRLVSLQPGNTFRLYRFKSALPVMVRPSDLGHQTFSESGLQPIAVVQQAR